MNAYRKLLAWALRHNGGYYSDCCALSWNMPVWESIPAFGDLIVKADMLVSDHVGPVFTADDPMHLDPAKLQEFKDEWENSDEQNALYMRVIEGMRDSIDDDTYKTMRPEIANRYGISYVEWPRKIVKTDCGWRYETKYADTFYDVTFEFRGRGGKHLCVTEFEGKSLNMRAEALADSVLSGEDYSNVWCQKLLAMIHEWDLCFTPTAVKEEFDHQVGWHFAAALYDVHVATLAAEKEALEAQAWAERDTVTVTV